MKKEDIVKIVAGEFDLSEVEVLNYFDDIFDVLIECFRKNKNVNISEFGKFLVRAKLNPEGVKEKVVAFSPVKKLADDVNYYFNNLSKVNLRTLDGKVLNEIEIPQRIDIDLPQDFEEHDIIEVENVQDEEELLKDYLEPIIEKAEEVLTEEDHIETIEEDEEDVEAIEEEIQEEKEHVEAIKEEKKEGKEHIEAIKEEIQEDEEHVEAIEEKIIQEKREDDEEVVKEKRGVKEETQKDIDEEIKSVTKEDETLSKSDESKSKNELSISLEGDDEGEIESIKSGIFGSKNIDEDIDKILDERKKIIDNITHLELSVSDKQMEENGKESDESVLNQEHADVIEEEESQDLNIEQEITQEKDVEEKSFDVEMEMKSFLLEHINIKEKEKETLETDEYTVETKDDNSKEIKMEDDAEEISVQEKSEKIEVDSEEDVLSKENYEEAVTDERDKIIDEIAKRELELSDFRKEEETSILKKEISGEFTDEEKSGDEKIEHEKEEETPAPRELDKIISTDVEDVKEEIEKIFEERNKTLSKIVELNLDKPELDETTLPEKREEPQEVIEEQEVSKKDKSDEDEIVGMIEERQRILKKIQDISIDEFKKSQEDEKTVNEKLERKEETQKVINEEIISTEKEEKTGEEILNESDESKSEEELKVSLGDYEEGEVESIRSGIFTSENIEEDINKILDERKKIIDNITNLELSIFDKLMEDSKKESNESVINQDIENLTKIKMNLEESGAESISESTVFTQPGTEDTIDSPLEFKIKEDVKELHNDIVEEDSNKVEEITKNEIVEDPKNFDDIFIQDDQKVYAQDNDEVSSDKSENFLNDNDSEKEKNEKKDDKHSDSKNEKSNKKAFTIPWMILGSLIV